MARKGFSVFTPMVGTLVILITFLIVASMLESEKWNFQGLTETYQTIQTVGVNQEAQDRAVAAIRDSILTDLEENVRFTVPDCRNDQVLQDFDSEYEDFLGIDDWEEEMCENKSLSKVVNESYLTVSGLGLSSSYLEALIRSITNKYSLIRIKTNLCSSCDISEDGEEKRCIVWSTDNEGLPVSFTEKFSWDGNSWKYDGCENLPEGVTCPTDPCVDPTGTIEKAEVLGCDLDYYSTQGIDWNDINDNCQDGRIAVFANFSQLENIPIAVIRANTSQYTELEVYLPNEEKKFITDDPLGYYVLVLAHLFQNFTLLDPSWHGVGGTDDYRGLEDYGYVDNGYGDGSHWYHYKYAIQARVPSSPSSNPFKLERFGNVSGGVVDWIGNVSKTLLASYDGSPVDLFSEDDQKNPFLDLAGNCEQQSCNQNLREDNSNNPSCDSSWDWGCFWKFFDIGVTSLSPQETDISGGHLWRNYFEMIVSKELASNIFPGGDVSSSISGEGNAFSQVSGLLDSFTLSHFIAVNMTNDYDKKFFHDPEEFLGQLKDVRQGELDDNPLAKATSMIYNHLANNMTLKTSAGYAQNDPVIVNVSVLSEQYYYCQNITGGDNWDCGQWMAQYVPFIVGYTNDSSHLGENIGKENFWFLSLPLNFSCFTCTLYRVDEHYNVTRNSHKHPNSVNNTVLRVTFTRKKENYGDPGDENSLDLWYGDVNSTWKVGDDQHKIVERKVFYSCQVAGDQTEGSQEIKCSMNVQSDEVIEYLLGKLGVSTG